MVTASLSANVSYIINESSGAVCFILLQKIIVEFEISAFFYSEKSVADPGPTRRISHSFMMMFQSQIEAFNGQSPGSVVEKGTRVCALSSSSLIQVSMSQWKHFQKFFTGEMQGTIDLTFLSLVRFF